MHRQRKKIFFAQASQLLLSTLTSDGQIYIQTVANAISNINTRRKVKVSKEKVEKRGCLCIGSPKQNHLYITKPQ
jgi:hypothetical protein